MIYSLGNGDTPANPRPARGRGGRPRGPQARRPVQNPHTEHSSSYDDPDNPNELPVFSPRRPAGIYLVTPVLRGTIHLIF